MKFLNLLPNYFFFNFVIIFLSCFYFCFINQFLRFGDRPLGLTFGRSLTLKIYFEKLKQLHFIAVLVTKRNQCTYAIALTGIRNFFTDSIIYVIFYICEV